MEELDCLKCGACCYFGRRGKNVIGKTVAGIKIGLDGWCENHNKETKKCKIYENRPQVCRDFEKGGRPCLTVRRVFKRLEELNLMEVLNVKEKG